MLRRNKLKIKYQGIVKTLELDATQKKALENTWLEYFIFANRKASVVNKWNKGLQMVVIVCSILIPFFDSSKIKFPIVDIEIGIAGILGLIVAFIAAIERILQYEEKWRHFRQSAELMRNEGDDFFALTNNYTKFKSHAEAFKVFIENVTKFKRHEVEIYIKPKGNSDETGSPVPQFPK